MDLSTTYLGLDLPHPLVSGASPLVDDLDTVRRLEDAGATAITMHSLFEEQITREQMATFQNTESHGDSSGEALTYFPSPEAFRLGPDEYLEHLRKVKAAVSVPVIGSLNGYTLGGWLECAKLIEEAGADALELNIFALGSNPEESSEQIELRTVQMVEEVRKAVRIPLAVKLAPFYTSLAHFASRLERAGADGLVLFNRFYQPEIDVEELQVRRKVHLSTSAELPLRIIWLAILSPRVKASLAVTGGVHTVIDVLQSVMAGAHAVQLVSALLLHGPSHIATLRNELSTWLEEHEYHSLRQAQGSMNLAACPDPQAYGRANYMLLLQSWGNSP
jgi:dihydroorotate dehydrogenase (fumarate)